MSEHANLQNLVEQRLARRVGRTLALYGGEL